MIIKFGIHLQMGKIMNDELINVKSVVVKALKTRIFRQYSMKSSYKTIFRIIRFFDEILDFLSI